MLATAIEDNINQWLVKKSHHVRTSIEKGLIVIIRHKIVTSVKGTPPLLRIEVSSSTDQDARYYNYFLLFLSLFCI